MSSEIQTLTSRFVAAQLQGDRSEGLRLIREEGIDRGIPVPQLHEVLQEAQYEIGRLWQENRVSIAQEHLATAISQLALAQLYGHLPRAPRNGRRLLLSCVENEQHDMGPRLLSDALEMAGFDVRYLGANVPTDSLISLLDADRPDLLALSVTLTFNVPSLRAAVARVRERFGRLPIAAGGHAFRWSRALRGQLDVDVFGEGAGDLVPAIREVLGV